MELKLQTLTGKAIGLEPINVNDLNVEEIVHSLSLICRFGGHINRFYSVGQHSLLVHYLLKDEPLELRFAGLIHDFAESVIGDIITPLKNIWKINWYEDEVLFQICKNLDIAEIYNHTFDAKVKEADKTAFEIESYYLGRSKELKHGIVIDILEIWQVKEMVINKYHQLKNELLSSRMQGITNAL